jgi:hypothetical protein
MVGQGAVFAALLTPDARHVATLSEGGDVRLWPVFANQPDFVASAQASLPRCLTPQQRGESYLAPQPPDWCITRQKWPYTGEAWRRWLAQGRGGAAPAAEDD